MIKKFISTFLIYHLNSNISYILILVYFYVPFDIISYSNTHLFFVVF